MKAQPKTYHKYIVSIHWVSALLIFTLIFTGIKMEHLSVSSNKLLLYQIHFITGTIVFTLTIIRLIVLLKTEKPYKLYNEKSFRERFRQIVYKGFYVFILAMCISGMLSLFLEGIFTAVQSNKVKILPEISADGFHPIMLSHHIMAKIMFLLLIFHITGFVIHLIQKKENTLKRIWFE